jgi:hypothetical protein
VTRTNNAGQMCELVALFFSRNSREQNPPGAARQTEMQAVEGGERKSAQKVDV